MGRKRSNNEDEERENEEEKPIKKMKENNEGRESMRPSMIKNKEKRSAVHAKLKHQKKLDKRKKAKAREAAEKKALELGEEVRSCSKLQFLLFLGLGFWCFYC